MLELIPMTLREANAFVEQYHRHHKPVVGHKFSIGVSDGEKVVGARWDASWTTAGPWKSPAFVLMAHTMPAQCSMRPPGELPGLWGTGVW